MKKNILLSVSALALMCIACNNSSNQNENKEAIESTKSDNEKTEMALNLDTTKLKNGETFYQCEMHPEVLSGNPGNCPKCGMELIEKKKN